MRVTLTIIQVTCVLCETVADVFSCITNGAFVSIHQLCVSVYVYEVTWLVAQHLHGRHELLAGLLVLALLVEKTAHVHIMVRVVLGKLFHQRLEQTGWKD